MGVQLGHVISLDPFCVRPAGNVSSRPATPIRMSLAQRGASSAKVDVWPLPPEEVRVVSWRVRDGCVRRGHSIAWSCARLKVLRSKRFADLPENR